MLGSVYLQRHAQDGDGGSATFWDFQPARHTLFGALCFPFNSSSLFIRLCKSRLAFRLDFALRRVDNLTLTTYAARLALDLDMPLGKRLRTRARTPEVECGRSVPFRALPSHLPSSSSFEESLELREEDDFLLVEAEESVVR